VAAADSDSKVVDLQDLNPEWQRRLGVFLTSAKAAGIPAHIIEAYRSNAVQAQYYAEKQKGLRPYPVAPPGASFHNYGYASDVLADDRASQQKLIDYANAHPEFGVTPLPGDAPHFQISGYKHVADLLKNPPAYQGGEAATNLSPFIASNQGYSVAQGYTPYNPGTMVAGPGAPSGTTINAASAPVAGALSRPGAPPATQTPGSPINDFYHSSMMHESGGRNIANAAGGAASGYYQFMPKTWASVRAAHPDLNLPENLSDANLDQQTAAYREFTRGNVEALQKAGVPITDKNVFMASFLGSGGATKFFNALKENPNANAADVFSAEAKANPSVFYDKDQPRSLQQVFDLQTKMHGTGNTTGFGPDAAPSTGPGGTAVAAAPAAAPVDQSWASQAWSKLTGSPTDAQGNPTGGQSPLQQLTQASIAKLGKEGQTTQDEAPERTALSSMQSPGARNVSPGLANVAQTYGTTLNSFSQPLTWSSTPLQGAGMPAAGLQRVAGAPVPGTTLNSLLPAPQQGIDPNLGYGFNGVGYG
jgi:hypothetical protein